MGARAKIFHFKKFAVQDDRCAMKIGTDAVLLAAWVNAIDASRILDIGTGCGVIALMLAQRTGSDALIDAVELDSSDAEQAKENVAHSPWPNKVRVHQSAIQAFEPSYQYDLIVSNPPYFKDSLLPPSPERTQARHATTLTLDELCSHAARMLASHGRFAVVLPVIEGNQFKAFAAESGLHLIRETSFHSRREKPQERWLFEFGFTPKSLDKSELILYESGSHKTRAYAELTSAFYL
jgi:tRNA1Val (adenine37-N6)-methyltransferase